MNTATPITQSILSVGSGGIIVEAECHLSNSLPAIIIVGLGNKAVDEARERVRSAFASSGITMPAKRITINLAPADMPKDSTSFDAAIALAIIQATTPVQLPLGASDAIIGELGLSGNTRAVRGILGKLRVGKALGITRFFIPADNLSQAQLIPDIAVVPIRTLRELYAYLRGDSGSDLTTFHTTGQNTDTYKMPSLEPLHEIVGQETAKRALCIAAAGGHNILLNGPPGTGKSMLAKCLPLLLPPMSPEEMVEVTHLYSLTSPQYDSIITARPFRAPHHSISNIALVGGSSPPRPGEISLAHHGVLFLDELPEFRRETIEALRQPLEDHNITITRARDTVTFPARFILVATANPCPCGYYGTVRCNCPAHRIQQYRHRLSGPIIDRIDMHIDVEAVEHTKLLEKRPLTGVTDDSTQQQIKSAHHQQIKRQGHLNSSLTGQQLRDICGLAADAKTLLDEAAVRLSLSARSYMRVLKVSRTIADISGEAGISSACVSEALRYRPRQARLTN